MTKLLITSYEQPDLDGTAGAFAYAEYLNSKGEEATVALFGKPHREAQFVLDFLNISTIADGSDLITPDSQVILVDASDLNGISSKINPLQVVEIYDHRKIHEGDKFPNAKVQVELVGAAATLIAEKFYKENLPISKESATLLYAAIISNTINFKANVTTDRDREVTTWLLEKIELPSTFIHDMFMHKSNLEGDLYDILYGDFAWFSFGTTKVGISQLEIVDVEKFVHDRKEEIVSALNKLKDEYSLNMIFFTCIDIEKATNTFLVIDKESQQLLEQTLLVKFENNIAHKDGIIMRKSIVPLIKEDLEKTMFF